MNQIFVYTLIGDIIRNERVNVTFTNPINITTIRSFDSQCDNLAYYSHAINYTLSFFHNSKRLRCRRFCTK